MTDSVGDHFLLKYKTSFVKVNMKEMHLYLKLLLLDNNLNIGNIHVLFIKRYAFILHYQPNLPQANLYIQIPSQPRNVEVKYCSNK